MPDIQGTQSSRLLLLRPPGRGAGELRFSCAIDLTGSYATCIPQQPLTSFCCNKKPPRFHRDSVSFIISPIVSFPFERKRYNTASSFLAARQALQRHSPSFAHHEARRQCYAGMVLVRPLNQSPGF